MPRPWLDSDDSVWWNVELRAEEVFVPAGQSARSWALPDDVPLHDTWTSRQAASGPTRSAVEVALAASAKGSQVRLHTIMRGHGQAERGAVSEWVVDVFDAPIPVDDEE